MEFLYNFILPVINTFLIILRHIFIVIHHIYCYTSCYLWILIFTPLKFFWPTLYWNILHFFLDMLGYMAIWYTWSAGYGVVEMGDDIRKCFNDRTLVLINHQTPVDALVLWEMFLSYPKIAHDSMWVTNEEFKYAPFGFVGVLRKDFFIPIGREKRDQGLIWFKDHLKRCYLPMQKKMLVLFPEGGFLYKRREKSQQFALKHNLPVLQHVSLPRLGAVQTIVDVCFSETTSENEENDKTLLPNDKMKWILDITIAYPQGKHLTLSDIGRATRPPCNTILLYRLFPTDQFPTDPPKVADWLYSCWQEKENILSTFYSTGTIPVEKYCTDPIHPHKIQQNPVQHIFIHIFFILSFCFFYRHLHFLFSPNALFFIMCYLIFAALKVMKKI